MNVLDKEKLLQITTVLFKEYSHSQTALKHETPFQLLIATILSAQCTDERVNMVTPGLFKKYPTIHAVANATPEEFEQDIRSTGFFRNKTKNILGAAQMIVDQFNGNLPETMEELIELPGVARKTANIVLSSCFNKTEGIAVDTHVQRLSGRIGFSDQKNPDKIEQDLMTVLPLTYWLDFSYVLVDHGRKVCQARKPKCTECVINKECPSAGKV